MHICLLIVSSADYVLMYPTANISAVLSRWRGQPAVAGLTDEALGHGSITRRQEAQQAGGGKLEGNHGEGGASAGRKYREARPPGDTSAMTSGCRSLADSGTYRGDLSWHQGR